MSDEGHMLDSYSLFCISKWWNLFFHSVETLVDHKAELIINVILYLVKLFLITAA